MADWGRTDHDRYRYSNGQHLTVDVHPYRRHRHRRSDGSDRRQTSFHRGYHSENEAQGDSRYDYHLDEDHSPSRRVSQRRQHPSPPRAINIDVPGSDLDRNRGPPSPPSPASPPHFGVHQQDRIALGDHRSSAPNLLGLHTPDTTLSRHVSAPRLHTRRSEENLTCRAFEGTSISEQGHSNVPNDGTSFDVPSPFLAASSRFDTATPIDLRPATGQRLSIASISGLLGPETYQYDPLGPRQFRLVKILSASMTDIRCEIVTQPLDASFEYTAISYAWGDPDDKAEITLEKDVLDEYHNVTRQRVIKSVTTSLHGALLALRHQDDDVYVWVDSLSIDQQNKDELSRQVQLMSLIYGRATAVAIWLGPERNDSKKALQLVEELAATPLPSLGPSTKPLRAHF